VDEERDIMIIDVNVSFVVLQANDVLALVQVGRLQVPDTTRRQPAPTKEKACQTLSAVSGGYVVGSARSEVAKE
jgi:hypothetical protein